ncbi:MAG: hypothetical protein ACRDWS_02775 [Acidimicrobiia bacterium]
MAVSPMRVTRHLVPPVLRATPWVGFAPAGVIALAMAWVATRQPTDTMSRLLPTRIGVLAIVIAVAFVFDDPASRLTAPAPSPLRHRRLIRAVAATIPAAALVVAVLVVASTGMDLVRVIPSEDPAPVETEAEALPMTDPGLAPFPGGRIALETAVLMTFTLAAAAAVSRRGETEPGQITSGVLLGVYAASWMIPDPVKPWADPGDQRWDTGAPWWWVAFGLFVLAGVGMCWDRRRRSWTPTRRTKRDPLPWPSTTPEPNVSPKS